MGDQDAPVSSRQSLASASDAQASRPSPLSYSSQTDEQLWQAILAGRDRAWRELVERYSRLVYSVCQYVGLSYADSGDCFQQTWLLLYRNRRKIKEISRLSSWLVTTAKREALRLRRKSAQLSDELDESQLVDDRLPDEDLYLVERQHLLEQSLAAIDRDCRQLLTAFFFADVEASYKDVAVRLGYSINTLGAKRRRCLEKLKGELQKNGYVDERNATEPTLLIEDKE